MHECCPKSCNVCPTATFAPQPVTGGGPPTAPPTGRSTGKVDERVDCSANILVITDSKM